MNLLLSFKGTEGAAFRLKYLSEITKITRQNIPQNIIECPERLLSVLMTLNCNNATNDIKSLIHFLQFMRNIELDPQVGEIILQNNCSMLPSKYVNSCNLLRNGGELSFSTSKAIAAMGKCHEEHIRETNESLSDR